MSKSKLTLIVDGNWLLMSRKSVMNNRFNTDEELIKELKLLMIKSLNAVLRTFPSIDNINLILLFLQYCKISSVNNKPLVVNVK